MVIVIVIVIEILKGRVFIGRGGIPLQERAAVELHDLLGVYPLLRLAISRESWTILSKRDLQ